MHNRPHTDAAKAKMSAARRGKPALWKRRPTREVNGELLYRCGRCEGFFPKAAFHPNRRTVLGIKTECKPFDILPRLKSGDSYGAHPGIEPE